MSRRSTPPHMGSVLKVAVSPPGRYFRFFGVGAASLPQRGCTNAPLSGSVRPFARGHVGGGPRQRGRHGTGDICAGASGR